MQTAPTFAEAAKLAADSVLGATEMAFKPCPHKTLLFHRQIQPWLLEVKINAIFTNCNKEILTMWGIG
jgi:hypothetical protein